MRLGTVYRRSVTEAVIKGLAVEGRSFETRIIHVAPSAILGDDLDMRVQGSCSSRIHLYLDDLDSVARQGRDALVAIVTRECVELMRQGWEIVPDDSCLPRRPVDPDVQRVIIGRMEVGPYDETRHITSMVEFLEHFGDPQRNGGPKGPKGGNKNE